jgi:tetratricopeptide (TPR) repeat protein
MKKLLLILILGMISLFSQNEKMIKALEKNIAILDTARNAETSKFLINNFERIADVETGEWIAQYYAAVANSAYSMREKDNVLKEKIIDKAEFYINRADSLNPNNSEIILIKSVIVYARISISPMERYLTMLPLATKYMATATELNPENPRVYLQSGLILLFTPEMMGGGKAKAKPVLLTAQEKYEKFIPESSIHPNWGRPHLAELLDYIEKPE